MIINSKRRVTLLEVIIALGLTVLILSTLMFFYQQIEMTARTVDQVEEENFKWRFLENRLSKIIPKVVSKTNKLKDFVFFTASDDSNISKSGSPSLIFTFENEAKLDKNTAFHAIGRLYLDPEGRLMFAYWPTPKWWKNEEAPLPKKETLLEGVEELQYQFFIPPDKGKKEQSTSKKKEEAVEPEPKGRWRDNNWLQEFQQSPALVKIQINMKDGEKKTFILPVSTTKKPIIYE